MARASFLTGVAEWLVANHVISLGLMLLGLAGFANAGRTLYRDAFVRTTSTFSCDRAQQVCQLTESDKGAPSWKIPQSFPLDFIENALIETTIAQPPETFYDRRRLVLRLKNQGSAIPLSVETTHDLSVRQLQSAASHINSYARDAAFHPDEPTFSTSWVIYPTWGSVSHHLLALGACLLMSLLCFEKFRKE